MGNKIVITEKQLKKIIEAKKLDEMMDMSELGKEDYYMDSDKNLQQGKEPCPEPYEMAELAVDRLQLHPDYYKNEDLMMQFISAFQEVLESKFESGQIKPKNYDKMLTKTASSRLNERKNHR